MATAADVGNYGDESLSIPCPWLLMSCGNKRHIQNTTNLSSGPCYDLESNVPALLGKRICCSCHEWLLLASTTTSDCCLLNLFSKETIQLPSVDFSYNSSLLSSPPTDPTCRIVFFDRKCNRLMVCQPGDGKYAEHIWDYDTFPNRCYTIVAGKVYFLCGSMDCLVSLEFEGSTYRLVVMEMNFVDPRKSGLRLPYIIECSGEIFLCYKHTIGVYNKDVTGFQIFKADLSNKQWVEVTSIGAHTIFLAYGSCCSIVELESTKFKANSIYFFNFNTPNLYVYDLGKGVINMYPIFCHIATGDLKFDWIMIPHNRSFGKILQRNKGKGWHKKRTLVRKNKEGLDRNAEVHNLWSVLPPDMLSSIGSYLFGVDYVRFLAVCKPWRLLATEYCVPPPLAQESCAPLLMFQENPSAHIIPVYRFFDPFKRMSYCIEIPELGEAEIRYSSEGWLLVSRGADCLFFWNPLTQQRIELPVSYAGYRQILSFSSPPTCSNCLVVAMDIFGRWICTLKHGEDGWTVRHLETDSPFNRLYSSSPVVVDNGLHYYLSEHRDMLVVNLQDDGSFHYQACVTEQELTRRRLGCCGSSEDDFLVEIDGAPALVTVPLPEGKVRVFQWNKSKKDWREMGHVDFGDKEMFLSRRSWLLEKIDGGGMGNTVFFPLIDEDGANDGVFYSFATRRYHSFYNGYSCTAPYFVGKPVGGVWVKPVRTRYDDRNLKWC